MNNELPEYFEKKINIEKIDDDTYKISGNEDELLIKAELICNILHKAELFNVVEYLKNGEELRPSVYAVWFDRKGLLHVQNRNARGDKQYQEEMVNAINEIFNS